MEHDVAFRRFAFGNRTRLRARHIPVGLGRHHMRARIDHHDPLVGAIIGHGLSSHRHRRRNRRRAIRHRPRQFALLRNDRNRAVRRLVRLDMARNLAVIIAVGRGDNLVVAGLKRE